MSSLPGFVSDCLNNAAVPVIIVESSDTVVSVNQGFAERFPWLARAVIGRSLSSLSSDQNIVRDVLEKLHKTGLPRHVTLNLPGEQDNSPVVSCEATFTPFPGFCQVTLWPADQAAGRINSQQDPLTGLPRYELFLDRIEQSMIASQRIKKSVAIMLIGIDQMEQINDGLGFEAGNQLVSLLAGQLSHSIRRTDTLARPFADQFGLVMQITSVEDSVLVAQKILKSLAQEAQLQEQPVNVTASVGISLYPDDGEDAELLIRQAESALRLVRKQGGHGYEFFSQGMNDMARHRIEMENRIRQGLLNEEFVVYYQPKVNLENNAVVGAEALVRWLDPELGLVSPAEFIPIAEETALIGDIGHYVMQKSCEQNMAWQQQGLNPIRISVNVTASQFHDRLIVDKVKTILAQTGLESRFLELEITESTLVGDMERVIEKLHAFRELGLHISIDDFGTGYSSLSYLSHFPITTLKIDRAFVMDMESNAKTAEITNAIIGLSHGLSLEVVAEGAEIHKHVNMLREKGCDLVQGFYFSKPLPADEFTEVLKGGFLYEHD